MGLLKRRIIEAMEPTEYELARRWIPVEERLPEEGAQVLVARRLRHWKDVMIDTLIVSSWFEHEEFCGDEDDIPYSGVTHWMPMPEPPAPVA